MLIENTIFGKVNKVEQISIDEICRSPADLRKMLQELNKLRDEYAKDKDIWTLFKIQFLKLDIRAKYRIQL